MEKSLLEKSSHGIKAWTVEDRPREKFIGHGRTSLSDAELIGILLGNGYHRVSAVDLARELLSHCGNDLNTLAKKSLKELQQIKGIGVAKALSISAALELGRRRKELPAMANTVFSSSKAIYEAHRHLFEDLLHEEFRVLLLSRSCRKIADRLISIGGVGSTIADPKKILREVVLHQAESLVLMHNHPSGSLQASDADRALTAKVVLAAKSLDAQVLDHIIFTNAGYYSFNDQGEKSLTPP